MKTKQPRNQLNDRMERLRHGEMLAAEVEGLPTQSRIKQYDDFDIEN